MTPEEMDRMEEFNIILGDGEELSADEQQELLHLIELAELAELGEAIAGVVVEKRAAMR